MDTNTGINKVGNVNSNNASSSFYSALKQNDSLATTKETISCANTSHTSSNTESKTQDSTLMQFRKKQEEWFSQNTNTKLIEEANTLRNKIKKLESKKEAEIKLVQNRHNKSINALQKQLDSKMKIILQWKE